MGLGVVLEEKLDNQDRALRLPTFPTFFFGVCVGAFVCVSSYVCACVFGNFMYVGQ